MVWLSCNKLKLNRDKTELLIISPQHQPSITFLSLTDHDGSIINPSLSARNIGVVFDNHLNLERQVTAVCKSAIFRIRKISRLRKFLSLENAKYLVHTFVTSSLDHCNSLLFGLPKYLIQR